MEITTFTLKGNTKPAQFVQGEEGIEAIIKKKEGDFLNQWTFDVLDGEKLLIDKCCLNMICRLATIRWVVLRPECSDHSWTESDDLE